MKLKKNFIVLRNNISSLEYSPIKVKDDFICSHNPIKSLVGLVDVGGHVFTNLFIPEVKSQEFVYNSVTTYKYSGISLITYLEKECKVLTEEERIFELTRRNLQSAISKMINNDTTKKRYDKRYVNKKPYKYNLMI